MVRVLKKGSKQNYLITRPADQVVLCIGSWLLGSESLKSQQPKPQKKNIHPSTFKLPKNMRSRPYSTERVAHTSAYLLAISSKGQAKREALAKKQTPDQWQKMGMPGKKWFRVARRKLFRSAPRETLIVLHNNNTSRSCFSEATTTRLSEDIRISVSKEELAAIQIQACFRGHLILYS